VHLLLSHPSSTVAISRGGGTSAAPQLFSCCALNCIPAMISWQSQKENKQETCLRTGAAP